MIESLPSRPLKRSEIEELENYDGIDLITPIYADEPGMPGNDLTPAFVLAIKGTMKAIALTRDGWEVVEESEYPETPGEGLQMDAYDEMERLEQEATDAVEMF